MGPRVKVLLSVIPHTGIARPGRIRVRPDAMSVVPAVPCVCEVALCHECYQLWAHR